MIRNIELYARAKKLRREGCSYSKINRLISVPKSTLSDWLSGIKWSLAMKNNLNTINISRFTRQVKLMNKARKIKKIKNDKQIAIEAKLEYEHLRINPLFIAGTAIYWGEGEKGNTGRVSVINTDYKMLKIMIKYFTEILKVGKSQIRVGLFLYSDLNTFEQLKYWSKTIKIPESQFIKPHIFTSKVRSTNNHSLHGTCNIYINNIKLKVRVITWIQQLAVDIIGKHHNFCGIS